MRRMSSMVSGAAAGAARAVSLLPQPAATIVSMKSEPRMTAPRWVVRGEVGSIPVPPVIWTVGGQAELGSVRHDRVAACLCFAFRAERRRPLDVEHVIVRHPDERTLLADVPDRDAVLALGRLEGHLACDDIL